MQGQRFNFCLLLLYIPNLHGNRGLRIGDRVPWTANRGSRIKEQGTTIDVLYIRRQWDRSSTKRGPSDDGTRTEQRPSKDRTRTERGPNGDQTITKWGPNDDRTRTEQGGEREPIHARWKSSRGVFWRYVRVTKCPCDDFTCENKTMWRFILWQ